MFEEWLSRSLIIIVSLAAINVVTHCWATVTAGMHAAHIFACVFMNSGDWTSYFSRFTFYQLRLFPKTSVCLAYHGAKWIINFSWRSTAWIFGYATVVHVSRRVWIELLSHSLRQLPSIFTLFLLKIIEEWSIWIGLVSKLVLHSVGVLWIKLKSLWFSEKTFIIFAVLHEAEHIITTRLIELKWLYFRRIDLILVTLHYDKPVYGQLFWVVVVCVSGNSVFDNFYNLFHFLLLWRNHFRL